MATYYVRISGNDSSAGTSAGAAWRTLSKAFTTVAAGDQVYIGAGTYREALTISTAWGSETKFTGDYTGQYTGDAGIVYWSAYTNGDRARGGTRPLTTSGTPRYWTFENIVFSGCRPSDALLSITVRDFKFTRCSFLTVGPSPCLTTFSIELPPRSSCRSGSVPFSVLAQHMTHIHGSSWSAKASSTIWPVGAFRPLR